MRGALIDGEVVRNIRISRGLPQKTLAALAECDVKTIRHAEQGQRLDLATVKRIARALQTELGRIVVDEEPDAINY